jgi:tRNA-splicing ligase RtcB
MSNIFGVHDQNTLNQLAEVAKNAVWTALMADGHLGYIMPVGGVAAYRDTVSVSGVGFDIACGNCAIQTNIKLDDLGRSNDKRAFMLNRYADEIAAQISFGIGRTNLAADAPTDHVLFSSGRWDIIRDRAGHGLARQLKDKAIEQLGTVGSGNHYVDVFVGDDDYLWVGVHFGSRGLGHTIASGFASLAAGQFWNDRVPETENLLSLQSSMGQDYWELMELAGEYAYAGREWVAQTVVNILGGKALRVVHNHHNFAWKEKHGGADVIVVRKGATPAFPGQEGFVGGSMGDISVILRGTDTTGMAVTKAPWCNSTVMDIIHSQTLAMFSTVHGAGRVMSRNTARGKLKGRGKNAKLMSPGLVSQEMMDDWITKENVILRGGGRDESPHVYRRLPEVLLAQNNTVEIEVVLKPLIVVMAPEHSYDPYKD